MSGRNDQQRQDIERAERQVAKALDEIDKSLAPINEYKVFSTLSAAIDPKLAEGTRLSTELIAELIGFRFKPVKSASATQWGTYFGPAWLVTDEAGTKESSPDISQVSPDVLTYWRRRIAEAEHPVLRAVRGSMLGLREEMLRTERARGHCSGGDQQLHSHC